MAPPTEQLNIDDPDAAVQKHPFFCSVRMTYVICGFVGTLLHHSLRSAINISILCMVAERPTLTSANELEMNCNRGLFSNKSNNGNNKKYGDLLWDRDQEVLFPSVFFYGYAFALPIAGYFSDKYGGKELFISSTMFEGAIFLLMPVCARANFWLAVVMRVFQGLAGALGGPARYGLFTVWAHPTERSASIAFGFFGFNIGNLLTYPIVGWLCEYGWDYIFYMLGVIVFSAGFIMNYLIYNNIDDHPRISPEEYRYLKPSQKSIVKKHKTPWKSILKSVPVYAFIFTHFWHCFGAAMQTSTITRYLKESMAFPLEDAGLLTAALYGASTCSTIIGIILNAQVEKRPKTNVDWFHRIIHLLCCWAAIPLVTAVTFLNCKQRWISFSAWFFVFCVTDIAFCAGYFPTLSFIAPSHAALLIGIANCAGQSTSVLVPVAITQIVPTGTSKEWDHAVAMLIAVYFLDGISFAALGSSKLQPWGLIKDDNENKS